MIDLVERDDVHPVCPHCQHALAGVWYQALKGFMGKRYIYFCPGCHSVLGISHRKGFWMG